MCSLIFLSLKDKKRLKIEINAFFDFLSQYDGFMYILSQCDALSSILYYNSCCLFAFRNKPIVIKVHRVGRRGGGGDAALARTGSTRAIFPDKYYCDMQTDTNHSILFYYLDKLFCVQIHLWAYIFRYIYIFIYYIYIFLKVFVTIYCF